jgi:hypothetical protein
MIATAIFLLAAQPAAPAPPGGDSIVVIGERLKSWRGRVSPTGQAMRCVTERSTRDADIDRIGCDTMVTCITPMRGRIQEAADRRRPRAERQALEASYSRDLTACFTRERDRRIADLAERRYEARNRNQNAQD